MTTRSVIVAGANAGGAARAISHERRLAEGTLTQFLKDPPGKATGGLTELPVVAAVQEASVDRPSADIPAELERDLRHESPTSAVHYHPTVRSDSYPLDAKWRKQRWRKGGPDHIEQGMLTCSHGAVGFADALVTSPSQDRRPFRGLVLDLPVVEFKKRAPGVAAMFIGGEQFRFGYYQGNRDTEPRVATAHRVWLGGGPWTEDAAQFVLINIHIGTLKEEDSEPANDLEPGEVGRKHRNPTGRAIALRYLHLGVIASFITERVYRKDVNLPVVVVGDFNATAGSAEVREFCKVASLVPVFPTRRCWNCTQPKRGTNTFFTTEDETAVITRDAKTFERITGITGDNTGWITVTEWCRSCNQPQFTHKRNFGLIDNILITNPNKRPTRFALQCVDRGIRFETYFSDHLPTWAELVIS